MIRKPAASIVGKGIFITACTRTDEGEALATLIVDKSTPSILICHEDQVSLGGGVKCKHANLANCVANLPWGSKKEPEMAWRQLSNRRELVEVCDE
jgi:hypothetical protein